MSAIEAFNAGKLDDAIQDATSTVKAKPTDITARHLLGELLCFNGELERADKQLETLSTQSPQASMPLALFRQLIRAEMARHECFHKGRVPDLLDKPDPLTEKMIRAWMCRRDGNWDEAKQLIDEIEEKRPHVSGTCNGEPFEDFRDQDDFCMFFFETITSTGKYFWIPFHRIATVELHPPKRPIDGYWSRASMEVVDGPHGDVYLPNIYLGSREQGDASLTLGRSTDWKTDDGQPAQGLGRRMYWADQRELSLPEIESLSFNTTSHE